MRIIVKLRSSASIMVRKFCFPTLGREVDPFGQDFSIYVLSLKMLKVNMIDIVLKLYDFLDLKSSVAATSFLMISGSIAECPVKVT